MIQLLINSIILASIYIAISYSIFIIYRLNKFFNFAHAIFFSFGGYFVFLFFHILNWNYYISILSAILSVSLVGCLIELVIYKPLRNNKSSLSVMFLASIGIYTTLQNLISLVFGDDTKSIRTWEIKVGINFFGAYITPIQVISICCSVFLVILVGSYFHLSRIGRVIRAVDNDMELSKLSGIQSDRIIVISFVVGSALASIIGILISMDVYMSPNMGMNLLLMGIVSMIIGGLGSLWGLIMGSLFLAIIQNLAAWYINSQWMDATTFILLLIFLLFRPQGFAGKKVRRANV